MSHASAAPVSGFLDASVPLVALGDVSTTIPDPILHIHAPAPDASPAPLVFHVERARLTRVTYDQTAVEGAGPVSSVVLPGDEYSRTTTDVVDAIIEISALEPDADVLVAPTDGAALGLAAATVGGRATAEVLPDGLTIQDGFRKMWGERRTGSPVEWEYEYHAPGPLVSVEGLQSLALTGAALGYVWGADVLVRNATGGTLQFDTGASTSTDATGTARAEHYEYLLLELGGIAAQIDAAGLTASIAASALTLAADGRVHLLEVRGTFTSGRAFYRAEQEPHLTLVGNLTLDVTPRVDAGQAGDAPLASASRTTRAAVRLSGEIDDVSMVPFDDGGMLDGRVVAVGAAGGATIVGLAAWYVLAAKGVVVAAPLMRPRGAARRSATVGEAPGDLLFDSDRFALYHMIRARAGLSAADAARLSGIERAGEHLERLADGGLLVPLADGPRRYALPGALSEARATRIVLLREDSEALAVARLLALYGLTPQDLLVRRAARATPGVRPRVVPGIVERLHRHGLVLREPGEEGLVVDPADELFACLEAMGETPAR